MSVITKLRTNNPYVAIETKYSGLATSTEGKIRSFARLPRGWHYGSGTPISHNIIATALAYHHLFASLGFVETDAFPGVGGEIMVTAYYGEHYVGVTVENNRTFTVTWEFAKEDRLYESDLSGIKASELLYNIASSIQNETCNTSSLSTLNIISTNELANLTIWHSRYQAMVPAHQLYVNRVAAKSVETYASMRVNATPALEESRQYFGPLTIA